MKNIPFQAFQQIHNAGLSLDHVYLLLQIEAGVDVKSLCEGSLKLGTLYHSIYRKGLITQEDGITLTGKEFINFVNEEESPLEKPIVTRRKKVSSEGFELWWKTYPGTDTFVHNGKKFTGTRALRVKKDDCKAKFNNILHEGEYTAQELVDALNFEVEQKKQSSITERANKLTYMQNSLTYLNQRTFESFIELIRSGITNKTESVGGTDI